MDRRGDHAPTMGGDRLHYIRADARFPESYKRGTFPGEMKGQEPLRIAGILGKVLFVFGRV
jgi:hypothetical protein